MNRTDWDTAMTAWEKNAAMPGAEHLDTAAIYRLSGPGGLDRATPDELAHLAACPGCLDQWDLLCFIGEDEPSGEMSGDLIGFGRLKAAAADDTGTAPLVLTSGCGRFKLGLFPEPDRPGAGMVTLDILEETPEADGRTATVKDARGTTVLAARLVRGRAAVKTGKIGGLDLSIWTVTLT